MQNFCFCQLNMQILWRRGCSRVVDLKLPIIKQQQRLYSGKAKSVLSTWNPQVAIKLVEAGSRKTKKKKKTQDYKS